MTDALISGAEWARKIAAREDMNDRLRGQRDKWRQWHKAQEREKMERKSPVLSKPRPQFSSDRHPVEAEIRRGREREEELQIKYDAEHAENQRSKAHVKRLRKELNGVEAGLRETSKIPIIGDDDRFVLSPVEDFEACRQAKFRFLVHGTKRGGQPAVGSLRSRVRTL